MTLARTVQRSSKSETGSRHVHEWISQAHAHLCSKIRGKNEMIELSIAAFLGGGHVLYEGPPGTGKTSLAKAIAEVFGGAFRRIQMTSDLLPSDIVGVLRLIPGAPEFEFRKGPIFANIVLADELNRSSPKTQSALLEAMAEGTVSVDGKAYALPQPFFVAATQNPTEFQGVYPLAESQLDRFMLKLTLDTPEKSAELGIYRSIVSENTDDPTLLNGKTVLSISQTLELKASVARVHVEESVLEYVSDLVRATRSAEGVSHGVSVRGGIQLITAARSLSFVRGRDYVVPKDVADVAVAVLAHRLCYVSGEPDSIQRQDTILRILEQVKAPK